MRSRRTLLLVMTALAGIACGVALVRFGTVGRYADASPHSAAALRALRPNASPAPNARPDALLRPPPTPMRDTHQGPGALADPRASLPDPMAIRSVADPVDVVRWWLAHPEPTARQVLSRKLDEDIGAAAVKDVLDAVVRPEQREPQVVERWIEVGGVEASYTLYIPRRYNADETWPMHIHLHGGGETVTGQRSCARNWGRWPLGRMILVCPSVPHGRWWLPENDAVLVEVYRQVIQELNVDTDRVSLGGLSNGGNGTWHLGVKYPWLWSTLIPRCAAGLARPSLLMNFKGTPALVIHGERDHQISVEYSRRMVKALRQIRNPVRFIEVEGGGHEYFKDLNPDARPWMMRRMRKARDRFVYTPTPGNDPGLIHWVYAPGLSAPLQAEIEPATMQRPETVIRLDAELLPPSLTVFFPPRLVPRDTPVRVEIQGETRYAGPVVPSAEAVLMSYDLTRDRKRVWDAAVHVTPPRPMAPTVDEALPFDQTPAPGETLPLLPDPTHP